MNVERIPIVSASAPVGSLGLRLSACLHGWTWKTWHYALITAVVGTIAFYVPLIAALQPGNAHWPGFMLTYDQRVALFPSFIEGYRRFWHGGLLGIDFFTDDGASVFAYRANFSPFYPPYILAYLLVDCSVLKRGMLAYVTIYVVHEFLGLFFTVVLARRYLGLPTASAVLCASLFGLSWYAADYQVQSAFYYQMMLLPAIACAMCWLLTPRNRLALVWMSPVFVCFVLTNYVPMMIMGLLTAFATTIVAYKVRLQKASLISPYALLRPVASVVLALGICSPYFLAQLHYKSLIGATATDIDTIAHSMAFNAFDLFNGISQYLDLKRTRFEAIFVVGMVPLFLAIAGLDTILRKQEQINDLYKKISAVFLSLYVILLLPTFGGSLLTACDAFFYAIPVLGKMHIYQRYLLFSSLFLAIAIAVLATVATSHASTTAKRNIAYIGIAIWFGLAIVCDTGLIGAPTSVGPLQTEAFLVAVTGVALALCKPNSALLIASMLAAVVGLYPAYSNVIGTNVVNKWKQEPDPLGPELSSMLNFIQAHKADSALPKVIVAETGLDTYFSRNLPWLVGARMPMESFQGYPPHLASIASYYDSWVNYGVFDMAWLQQAGVDFVAWKDADPAPLASLLSIGFALGPVLDLPDGNHLGKLTAPGGADHEVFNLGKNSTFISPPPLQNQGWTIRDGRLEASAGILHQVVYQVGFSLNEAFDLGVDIDPGSHGHISIAFANQVITSVVADGKQRIEHHLTATSPGYLIITGQPDFEGSLSNLTIKSTDVTSSEPNFDNGVFRFTGDGDVASFSTDYTRRARLDVDAHGPGQVDYLLWPNPYMVPYVDGVRHAWVDPTRKPLALEVGAGHHVVEVRFESRLGTLFIVTITLYSALMVAGAAGMASRPAWRIAKRQLVRN